MTPFATVISYIEAFPEAVNGWADETAITTALAAACEEIRRYCSQTFTLTENDVGTVHGTGRSTILLPELPIVAVNTVTIDAGLTTETVVTDFRIDRQSGVLFRPTSLTWSNCWPAGRWPAGFLNITVDYDHGYTEVPADVVNVAVQLAHQTIVGGDGPANLTSETITSYSYTKTPGIATTAAFDGYRRVLDLHKTPRIPVA